MIRKILISISLLSVFIAATPHTTGAGPENILKALGSLCVALQGTLAVGMLLLVVLAALVYAVGQTLGAETRARASVWATAMFVGAIIGALIYLIVPWILSLLMTGQADSTWVQNCCTTDPQPDCMKISP
ncbi:MAG: hypothetical protein WCT31_05120 [Candidatus Micrarchaeia archaeon]|jgi:hypothetical protein